MEYYYHSGNRHVSKEQQRVSSVVQQGQMKTEQEAQINFCLVSDRTLFIKLRSILCLIYIIEIRNIFIIILIIKENKGF